MNLRKKLQGAALFVLISLGGISPPASAQVPDLSAGILEGLPRLACETILCLATGSPPTQCNPALNYFYSLDAKKWKDILKLRMNFLSLCPAGGEPGMPSLVSAIANGAGRCDNDYLLPRLNQIESTCGVANYDEGYTYGGVQQGQPCGSSSIPQYCRVYQNHEYTRITMPVRQKVCERRNYWNDEGQAPQGHFFEGNKLCRYVWVKNPNNPFK